MKPPLTRLSRFLNVVSLPIGLVEYWFRRADAAGDIFPEDADHGVVGGTDSERIVVMGEGTATGLGTTTHELGMAAQFARKWSGKTGTGVEWSTLSLPDFRLRSAPEAIRSDRLRFQGTDVVILMIGIKDTLQLTRRRAWSLQMNQTLDALSEVLPVGALVAVAKIPPMDNAGSLGKWARQASGHHARALNRGTADALNGRTDCVAIEFPDELQRDLWLPESRQTPYAHMYAVWSEEAARTLVTRKTKR